MRRPRPASTALPLDARSARARPRVWLAFDTVLERRVAVKMLEVPRRRRDHSSASAAKRAPSRNCSTRTSSPCSTPARTTAAVHRARVRRGRDAQGADPPCGPLTDHRGRRVSRSRSRARSTQPTRGGSCTATSSRRTSCSTPSGGAKVTDFGIARSGSEDALTQGGRVLGTTDYVSPEQALGHEVTGQSDIYSLGVVLYEALTGRGAVQRRRASSRSRRCTSARSIPDVQRLRARRSRRRSRPSSTARPRSSSRGATADAARDDRRPRGGARDRDGARPAARAERPTRRAAHAAAPTRAARAAARAPPRLARRGVGGRRARRRRRCAASRSTQHPRRTAAAGRTRPPVERGADLAGAGRARCQYNPFGTGPEHAATRRSRSTATRATLLATTTTPVAARQVGRRLSTWTRRPIAAEPVGRRRPPTPGFDVQVWGADACAGYRAGPPPGISSRALGWRGSAVPPDVAAVQAIALDGAGGSLLPRVDHEPRAAPAAGTAINAEIGEFTLCTRARAR